MNPRVVGIVEELQRGLYAVGAELGTNPEAGRSFVVSGPSDVARLEVLMHELEEAAPMPAEFILPGSTPAAAALDVARAIVRRAERRCVTLQRSGAVANEWVVRRLNRLSLLLFVLARYEESLAGRPAPPAKSLGPGRSN